MSPSLVDEHRSKSMGRGALYNFRWYYSISIFPLGKSLIFILLAPPPLLPDPYPVRFFISSVADPDPPDPYQFPESGSVAKVGLDTD